MGPARTPDRPHRQRRNRLPELAETTVRDGGIVYLTRDYRSFTEGFVEIRDSARIMGSFTTDDSIPHTNGDPLLDAYVDVWQRTIKLMSPTWQKRLIDHFGQFLDVCCWEAQNRLDGAVPTPEVYRAMRGAGLMPYIDFIEIVTRSEIPEHIYRLPFITNLNQAVSDANLWTNDLFSCVQEALGGDVHNFVVVYQHAHGTTFQSAVDAIGTMTQERIDQFTSLVDRFLEHDLQVSVPAELSHVLRVHVHTMCCWLSGQLQWRYKSRRWSRPLHDPASWLDGRHE